MARWPDFFIVGATRGGTTSLYYYLRGHPDIFMPSTKEPQFFSATSRCAVAARRRTLPVGIVKDEMEYLRLFHRAGSDQVVGEASTAYLSDEVARERIRKTNPRAKIIAILRKPIDRAYSSYLLSVREGREPKPSFFEALQEDYEYMVKAPSDDSYIWKGLYYRHVKGYLNAFGPEQVRIYLYEDLSSDASGLVEDVCSFLEVPFYEGTFFDPNEKYHTYGTPRNPLYEWLSRSRTIRATAASVVPMHVLIRLRDRLVSRERPKPPLDRESYEFLRAVYREDVVKLQNLIDRDLSDWL